MKALSIIGIVSFSTLVLLTLINGNKGVVQYNILFAIFYFPFMLCYFVRYLRNVNRNKYVNIQLSDELFKLFELKQQGVISEADFLRMKYDYLYGNYKASTPSSGSTVQKSFGSGSGNAMPPLPKNYMAWAIVSVLLFLPCGIVATVYASKVQSLYLAGDYTGARQASNAARGWSLAATVVAAVFLLIGLIAGLSMIYMLSH
jgi:uncharacterized membrane protein YjgN (DUF898 family)